jgi:CRP-like cAMP-binding protein
MYPAERSPTELLYMQEWCSTLMFFKALPPSYVRNICAVMQFKLVGKGETVVKKGDLAESFFIVASGKVHVLSPEFPHGVIATLGKGETFGELALHQDSSTSGKRANTLRAAANEDVKLATIDKQRFREFLGSAKVEKIAPGMVRRAATKPVAERGREDEDALMQCFRYSKFFAQFPAEAQRKLCYVMTLEPMKVGLQDCRTHLSISPSHRSLSFSLTGGRGDLRAGAAGGFILLYSVWERVRLGTRH